MLEKVYKQLRRIFNKDDCFEECEESGFYCYPELEISDEKLMKMRERFKRASRNY